MNSFPALSRGFEIETELTIHALELRMPVADVDTAYGARPAGSKSKLATWRDGLRILKNIVRLYIAERPLAFYSLCAALIALAAVGISIPLLLEYSHTGLVSRFPTAILAASMMVCALVSLACGLIPDNVARGRHEARRLAYLATTHPTFMHSRAYDDRL
ncbi:MAG: hypothetical protein ACK5ME_08605 [Parahaliea sp.]